MPDEPKSVATPAQVAPPPAPQPPVLPNKENTVPTKERRR